MAEIDKKNVLDDNVKKAFEDLTGAIGGTLQVMVKLTDEAQKASAALNGGNITQLSAQTKQYNESLKLQASAEREVIKLEQDKVKLSEANRKATEAGTKAAEKQTKQLAQSTSLYAQHSKALTEARNKAKDLALQYGENSKQFKNAAKEVANMDSKLKSIDGKLGQHQRNVGNYASSWKSLGTGLLGAFGITAGLAGVVSAMKKAHDLSVQFEKGLSNLSSITGLAGKQLQQLGKMARNMSKEYGISAVETLKAMELIGSAKPELLENSAALADVTEQVIVFAQAAGMELPESAASLTSIMNQLGHGAEQAANDINVLAAGSKAGVAPISYLASAIEKAGTTAQMMGISIEQVTGAIESIAPFYKEASMAGNSFDKVLLKLKANQIGYKDGVFDLNRAIDELRGMYAKGKTSVEIFGVEHSKMGELLVREQGNFNKLTEAVTGTNTAYEQQAINMDNYAGASARLSAKWDDLMMSFGNTKFATKLIDSLSTALDALAWSMMSAADIAEDKAGDLYKNLYPKDAVTNEAKIKELQKLLLATEDQIADLTDANVRANEQMGVWEKIKMGVLSGVSVGLSETELQNEINSTYKRISTLQVLYDKVDDELAKLRALPATKDVVTGKPDGGGKQAGGGGGGAATPSDKRTPTTDVMSALTPNAAIIEDAYVDVAKIGDDAMARQIAANKAAEEEITANLEAEEQKRQEIREQAAQFSADAVMGISDLLFENAAIKRDEEAQAELAAMDYRLENEKLDDEQRAELEKQRDKRERKMKRDAAKADKERAIFQIGISTAMAVMQAYAQLGPIAGTVAVPFILAGGALQAALVSARKIPAYFRGTSNHGGGPALVGDGGGGSEMVIEPTGKRYLTPATDTIIDLPRGSQVIPGKDVADKLTDMTREEMVRLSIGMPKQNAQNDYVAKLIAEEIKTRKAIVNAVNKNKPQDVRDAVAFEVKKMSKKL